MNTNRNAKILKEFGKNLQKLRKEKKLSIRGLANLADVDFSTVRRVENGESNPTLTTILAFAEALEVEPSHLLKYK